MADRIKGITIEIGGDTTGLSKALSGVNSEIKTTQSQLKDVERLLKLDPTNTELLRQKQKLLSEAVSETKSKLDSLKDAEKQVQVQFEQGKVSQQQYDALQREIIETENKLKDLEKQAASSSVALTKIGAAGDQLQEFGGKVTDIGKSIMPVSAAVAGIGVAAVKTTADFDAAMSQVKAISGATAEEFDQLRDKAREMGSKTKFSAEEAAEAMNYMAMAGWKTGDMLDGIEGIMNLAAASGENLATTSDIVTDAMTAFGLSANDSGHFADILAAASSSANTNVSMLGESFKYVAPLAGSMGYSAEDVSVALGMMANSGIKASQAGTSLRSIITRLVKPTKDSETAMNKLGISITDTDGTMKPFADVMEELREKFSGLTEEEKATCAAQLAGQEAMSGLLAIVNSGEQDFQKLSNAVANCSGVTQNMADTMQDNLQGQLTILKSQLQEAAISIGDTLVPMIRSLVSKLQEGTDWFNSLNKSQKETVVQIGLVVAAMGPALIAFGQMATGAGALFSAVSSAGSALTLLSASGGPLFLTATAAAALGAAFILAKDNTVDYYEEAARLTEAEQDNRKAIDDLRESYDNLTRIRKDTVMDVESQAQKENDLWKELQNITDENGKIKSGYEDRAAFITSTLSEALGTEISITDGVIQNYKDLQSEIDNLIEKKRAEATLNAYQGEYAEAVSNTKRAQDELSEATANAKSATDNYNEALEKQKELQAEYNQLQQDYVKDGTNDALRQQLYDLQDQMLINGETIEGLRSHMEENNQTMENARLAVEAYNTTIANYEGASAAIISGDQEKISQSLWLLQNDFKTTETATRESLVAQHETIKTELANARIAFEQGSPNITQAYLDGLEDLEMKSRVQLGLLAIAAGESASETAESVRSKTPEMEQAGTDFAAGLATGIQSGAQQASDAADQMANDSVDAVKTALDSHSPSRVTEEIGNEGFDAGLALGITEGAGQVTDAVTQVTDAATGALKNNLNLSQGDLSAFQSTTSSSWISWAALLTETLRTTLSQINTETNTNLQEMQTTIANYISEIEKNWEKQLNEIRKEHEESMEAVNTKTTETMTEMSETIQTQTEQMKDDAVKAMNEMVIGIGEELSEVEPTIRAGFEPGVDYITSLIGEARTWGNHMMQELIQGLKDYLDELEDVCEDIADTISDNLHFTRPERGSLRNYEEWMPHFMQGLAKGIEDNKYLISEQIQKLADDMAILQNHEAVKQTINFTNRSVIVLNGEQIGEVVDEYLGEAYG